ncbi:MAG: universal stress protein [Pseudomonadota bacterium]
MTANATESAAPPVFGPIARMLVVVEPDDAENLLLAAAWLSARHGAELDVLICIEAPKDLAAIARATELAEDAVLEHIAEDRHQRIAKFVARTMPQNTPKVHLSIGKAFIAVIDHVVRFDIDLVIKTAEPMSGLHGFLFESTDQHLMRKCPCPVWIRLPDTPAMPHTILAAVDVDDWDASEPDTLLGLNQRVIEMSRRLASGPGAVVHVLHAWEAVGEGMIWTFASGSNPRLSAETYVNEIVSARWHSLEALIRPFKTPTGGQNPRLVEHLVRGSPHNVIAEQARHLSADIIVMGTVARTGLGGVIIGNTAENILNAVKCSVVTVKPEGFISPIVVD